jgi:hypothetical protein
MKEQATMIKNSKEFFESCRRSFGNSRPRYDDNQTDYVVWTSPSWYPPVNKKQRKSKVPDDAVTPSESSSTSSTNHKTTVDYDCSLVVEYGWVPVNDRYYNIENCTFAEKYPFGEEGDIDNN